MKVVSIIIIIIRVVPPLTPSLLNAETLHTYPLTPTLLKNFLYTIYVIYIYNTFYNNKGVLVYYYMFPLRTMD